MDRTIEVKIKTWDELEDSCVVAIGENLIFRDGVFVSEMAKYCGEVLEIPLSAYRDEYSGVFVYDGWNFSPNMFDMVDDELAKTGQRKDELFTVRVKSWDELVEDCDRVDDDGDLDFGENHFVRPMKQYCDKVLKVALSDEEVFVYDGWRFTNRMYEFVSEEVEYIDSYEKEMFEAIDSLVDMNREVFENVKFMFEFDEEDYVDLLHQQKFVGKAQKDLIKCIKNTIQNALDMIEGHPTMSDTKKMVLMQHIDYITTHAMLIGYL